MRAVYNKPLSSCPDVSVADLRDLAHRGLGQEALAGWLKERVMPGEWMDASQSVSPSRGFLLVRAKPGVQERIAALLRYLLPLRVRDYDVEIAQDGVTGDPIPQQ